VSISELSALARELWVLWLMMIFAGIVFYAYRRRNKDYFNACAQIPFRADGEEMKDHG